MKLIAYTINTIVVLDKEETRIFREKGGVIHGDARPLDIYAVSRLRDFGFHLVDQKIESGSVADAFEFARAKMKEGGFYAE